MNDNPNPLLSTEETVTFSLSVYLKCVQNDYDEDEDEHVIIMENPDDDFDRFSFRVPPGEAYRFVVDQIYEGSFGMELPA